MAVASSDVESNAEEDQEELVNDEEAPPEVEEPEGDDNAKSVQIDGDEYIAVDVYDNKYYVSGSTDPGGSAALGESLLGGHDPLALATGHSRAFWALIACADSWWDVIQTGPGRSGEVGLRGNGTGLAGFRQKTVWEIRRHEGVGGYVNNGSRAGV
ncbi:hypothetical protein J132_09095 [Termitomyces sp. J132]|nr:hypothetical protein J132_09095 [Termitomyces sp. J132]